MKTLNTSLKAFKKALFTLLITGTLVALNSTSAQAQVEVSTGADLVSTYVWRGVAYSGPSIQPFVELGASGFAVGAWGSQGYDGFQEMDLYAGYGFDFGLSVGITDYYYPGSSWTDIDTHALEANVGYEIDAFSISANYIFGGSGAVGDDLYFEAGYSFDVADVFIGAGDGWHSTDTEFALVNIGVSASKDIVITDTFTLPLFGSVILNPDSEQLYILAGVSF